MSENPKNKVSTECTNIFIGYQWKISQFTKIYDNFKNKFGIGKDKLYLQYQIEKLKMENMQQWQNM